MPGLRNPVFRLPPYYKAPQDFLYLKHGSRIHMEVELHIKIMPEISSGPKEVLYRRRAVPVPARKSKHS